MSNETLFFVCGIALAVSAVLFSIVGLKAKNFPGKAFPVIVLWFAILVGGASTFAVLHAEDEQKAKAAEFEEAGEEFEAEGAQDEEPAGESPPKERRKRLPVRNPNPSHRQRAPAPPCSSPPTRPRSPTTRPA